MAGTHQQSDLSQSSVWSALYSAGLEGLRLEYQRFLNVIRKECACACVDYNSHIFRINASQTSSIENPNDAQISHDRKEKIEQ
jgi:hypothetical protein